MTDKRAQLIEEGIKLAYSSLDSHLLFTHSKAKDGSKKFHKDCIKEYARLITILSQLY
jgi:hypothetical protein